MMIPQTEMIHRLRQLCQADERLIAAMLYGSFALGEADRFSDIDCLLYFQDDALPDIDQESWLSQIAPLELYYHNEFGNGVAIFNNLVRAEFHFDPASKMQELASLEGKISFPSLETTLLVDKNGQLSQHLQPLLGPPPDPNNAQEVQFIRDSFFNWFLFGLNVLARGETARSSEILRFLQDYLLKMARLKEQTTAHWMSPSRGVEWELSAQAYRRLASASASLDAQKLWEAYRAAWEWGLELLPELLASYDLPPPDALVKKLERYLSELEEQHQPNAG